MQTKSDVKNSPTPHKFQTFFFVIFYALMAKIIFKTIMRRYLST